jgi:phosphotriesterase-related protein
MASETASEFRLKNNNAVKKILNKYFLFVSILVLSCSPEKVNSIQSVVGTVTPSSGEIWLSHEHILVDFIGADSIDSKRWNHDSVMNAIIPYLDQLKEHNVKYFVDATPAYLGRDVLLLEKLARKTGLAILTNTGFYGAINNKYIPAFAFKKTAEELAEIWINEYKNGIEGTSVKPGFIKISVDAADTLDAIDQKLVKAAAITHLQTGLTIASHTGEAKGLWPQLKILKEMNVSPGAFIWVHAQNEKDHNNYVLAAKEGCWISLDGLGWDLEKHVEKILFAKEHKILNRVLIAHDAGWYDPQKPIQAVKPYTNIFKQLYPALMSKGFSKEEFDLLISQNPSKAFSINIKKR